MGYSVVLPTLNEAGHIVKLIERIKFNFLEIKEEFEIILVDDNSTDGTIELGENIAKKNENIQFFLRKNLKKNLPIFTYFFPLFDKAQLQENHLYRHPTHYQDLYFLNYFLNL